MGVCVLGLGECGITNTSQAKTNVTNLSKTLTTMVSSKSQSVQTTSFTTQNVTINILAPKQRLPKGTYNIDGCDIRVNQNILANQSVSVSLNSTRKEDLQAQISNAIKSANTTANTNKTEYMTTTSTNNNTFNTFDQFIDNLVSTSITDTVTSSVNTIITNAQNQVINIQGPVKCYPGTPLITSVQSTIVSQIVTVLLEALADTSLLTTETSDSSNSQDVTNNSTSTGVQGAISALFNGIKGIMTGPLVVFGIGIILLAILAYVFRGPISKAMNKGASATPAGRVAGVAGAMSKFSFGRRSLFGRRRR